MTETKQAAGARTVHLALVQFESVLCDPAANTQKACRMIAEAAAEGADLVVLPELFSTGYELNIVGPHVPEPVSYTHLDVYKRQRPCAASLIR